MSSDEHKVSLPTVDYEDVLAARVLRKVWHGLAFFGVLILAVIGYTGFKLDMQRDKLEQKIALVEREADELRRTLQDQVNQARDIVVQTQSQSALLVQAGQSYQSAAAQQLADLIRLQEQVRTTQRTADTSVARTYTAIADMVDLKQRHARALAADSAATVALRATASAVVDSAQRVLASAGARLFSTWHVVVPEDRTIPIGSSGVSISFDDAKHNRLTSVRIKAGVQEIAAYAQLPKDAEIKFTADGREYLLRILEATAERRFLNVKSQALIFLERLSGVAPTS